MGGVGGRVGGAGTGSYDITLSNLQIGDVCMAGFALVFGNQAVAAYLDVHTVVSGVRVSSFASQGTDLTPSPNGAWYAEASRLVTLGPSIPYTITSGDIDANQRTTFRPMIYTASASNRTVFNQNESLFFWVSNIGPQDTT